MSRLTLLFLGTICLSIHTSVAAQAPGSSGQGGSTPPTSTATPVQTVSARSTPADADNNISDDGPSDFSLDLRVVSMRGPIQQTTSTGVVQQVMLVTIANFGHATTSSATLSLDRDIHGHPVGRTEFPIPALAPGAKVSLSVPFTVPPDLQGQICFTARLELPDPTDPVRGGTK
ncbi:MAG TPA: hypothetical protein VNU46_09100 [Gemmatimonadaceae bacterium]|nr:hypothetical protein [Gemmatimonadaceae bacterium]